MFADFSYLLLFYAWPQFHWRDSAAWLYKKISFVDKAIPNSACDPRI